MTSATRGNTVKHLLFLAAFFASFAFAGDATVNWANPTKYTDNTTLVPADITQTRIEYGSCNGVAFGTKAGEVTVTGSATQGVISALAAGGYCFRAYTTAKGLESVASNVASKTVPQAAPNAPVLTAVTVADTKAYELLKQKDRFVFLPIGTVPLGTPCLGDQHANEFNAVPRAAVTFTGNVRPPIVLAKCG